MEVGKAIESEKGGEMIKKKRGRKAKIDWKEGKKRRK